MLELEWVDNLPAAIEQRLLPSITVLNRIEGQPRAVKFDRALKAEVRDALWMITRQWQLGELEGDDAGSPCAVRLQVEKTPLSTYRPRQQTTVPFDPAMPLETIVEQLPLPMARPNVVMALDIRLSMGRYWLKLTAGIGNYRDEYLGRYAVIAPDPTDVLDAQRLAHSEVRQLFAAAAGRLVDGWALYEYLTAQAGRQASDGITLIDPAHGPLLDARGLRFVAWLRRLIQQPASTAESAWEADRLEYQFTCAAPRTGGGERTYVAEEYYHGRLDWYNVDLAPEAGALGPVAGAVPVPPADETQALLPVPLEYDGMPNTRWWAFEDRRTNLGAVDAATTDLATMLFVEFSLVYANDWFLIPCSLDAGSIASVQGLAVTNVFGERFWIDAAGKGPDDAWQRWRMFGVSTAGRNNEAADTSLLLLPTIPKSQEGDPIEEVLLLRDEIANMVWGVEDRVPLASGTSTRGSEAATELRSYYERELAARLAGGPKPEPEFAAPVYYRVTSTVPEHWIPFVPVHVPGSSRRIQLQRAALPRVLDRDPDDPAKVEPRTTLLRSGLDQLQPDVYFLQNEEVPRSGARVRLAFQRTRWRDGRVVIWLGAHKTAGRGEGSSGLAFDQLVNAPADRVIK